ncbi:MAG: hypothetical protein M5U12_11085 [Verrucomicrobia bacterium]|nr:hypothetical protein [Verrucomicrobiota bacterium]
MDTFEPVSLLVGAALPLLGRRLYWVFVAGVGFLAGEYLFHAPARKVGQHFRLRAMWLDHDGDTMKGRALTAQVL